MHHIQAKLSILRCMRCIDSLGYERSIYFAIQVIKLRRTHRRLSEDGYTPLIQFSCGALQPARGREKRIVLPFGIFEI